MLRYVGRVAAAVATVLLASVGVAVAPAQAAAGGGSLSTGSGVLYSGCARHDFSYSLALPTEAEYWNLDVTAYGPDGLEVSGAYLYDDGLTPTAGRDSVQFCGSDLAGRYTLRSTLEWANADGATQTVNLPAATFNMRKPATRTTLSASTLNPARGQVFRLTVGSKDERPNGYFANPHADVVVQKLAGGARKTVLGGKGWTGTNGKVVFKFRWASTRPVKMRAVTRPSDDYTKSVSRVVTIR